MIHNQVAFDRARAKEQAAFDVKVGVALFHIEKVLAKNDGKVIGESEDEIYSFLIADGLLGAMQSSKRIARAIKCSRRDGTILSKDDSFRFHDATTIVKTAIVQASEKDIVKVSFGKSLVRLELVSYELDELDLLDEIEYTDLGAYDSHHPLTYRLPGGVLVKLGSSVYE